MEKPLSERQEECLRLSATLHDTEIADRLGISVHTVQSHIKTAIARLGVQDRKAARRRLPPHGGGLNEVVADPPTDRSDTDVVRIRPDVEGDVQRPLPGLIGIYEGLGRWRTPSRDGVRVSLLIIGGAVAITVLLSVISAMLSTFDTLFG